jgi:hypothetical protein
MSNPTRRTAIATTALALVFRAIAIENYRDKETTG